VGLLLPATIIGLAPRTGPGTLVAVSYAGLTILALILASAAMPSPHLIKPAHHKARHGSARAGPVPYRATVFSFPLAQARRLFPRLSDPGPPAPVSVLPCSSPAQLPPNPEAVRTHGA